MLITSASTRAVQCGSTKYMYMSHIIFLEKMIILLWEKKGGKEATKKGEKKKENSGRKKEKNSFSSAILEEISILKCKSFERLKKEGLSTF